MSTKDDSGNEDSGVECPTCERAFKSERAMKVHHTKGHGESLITTEETCHTCGETFIDTRNRDRNSERRFCNNDCRREWLRSRTGDKHPRSNFVEVQCAHCDTTLIRSKWRVDAHELSFCDLGCLGQWRSVHKSGPDSHLYSSIEVECENCGAMVLKPPSHIDGRMHFCDAECHGQWASLNRVGENNPTYKGGGAHYYGPNWNRQRRLARERDGYICQDPACDIDNTQHLEMWSEMLHVHHIVRFGNFDDYREANKLDNLITLCRSCHLGKWENIPGLRPDVR